METAPEVEDDFDELHIEMDFNELDAELGLQTESDTTPASEQQTTNDLKEKAEAEQDKSNKNG
ncbi:hypothetical protein imdm_682 [gamma proteobacterium IMCC2047]|nr:hypothetical protein imdm_682 [gamma proteobacterium IMCC2047]